MFLFLFTFIKQTILSKATYKWETQQARLHVPFKHFTQKQLLDPFFHLMEHLSVQF